MLDANAITARIASLRDTARTVSGRLAESRQFTTSLEEQHIGILHRIHELETVLGAPPEAVPEPIQAMP